MSNPFRYFDSSPEVLACPRTLASLCSHCAKPSPIVGSFLGFFERVRITWAESLKAFD